MYAGAEGRGLGEVATGGPSGQPLNVERVRTDLYLADLGLPLAEDEEGRQQDQPEADEIVPLHFLPQIDDRKDGEDQQGDHFLYHFKLRAGVAGFMSNAIGGDLKNVFEERNPPTGENHDPKR